MSLFSFLQSSSSARPAPAGKGLFANVNFGSPGGAPMGMFNNPLTQQANKLGQDRTSLFQSLFPDKKMGPTPQQSPAMLAAGIAPRPAAALNEPAPFVGPVQAPKPVDPKALKLTPAGEKVAAKAALAAEAFKKKNYQAPPKPPSTRATMAHELTMGEKNQAWAEKYLAIPGNATQYNGLFAPTTQKTPAQVLAENQNKTPGGLAAQLQYKADKKAANTVAVMGALGAKPLFPAV